jgi:hypothetical protein
MEETKKLSIIQCRKVLEEGSAKYSDEQVRLIRDVLYNLGELDYLIFKGMQISDEKIQNQFIPEKAA